MKNSARLQEELLILLARIETDEVAVIRTLNEQDSGCGWSDYGALSLWDYAERILKLSRDRVGRYISVSRATQVVPEALDALSQDELTFSHLLGLAPVLKDPQVSMDEKKTWVETGKDCTVTDLREKILDSKPDSVAKEGESVRKKSKNLTKISFLVTNEEKEILDQMKILLRTKKHKDAILKMAAEVIKKKDPLAKAQRAEIREVKKQETCGKEIPKEESPPQSFKVITDSIGPKIGFKTSKSDLYLPAKTRHAVILRDGGACTHIDPITGKRCCSRHFTDIHHIIPRSHGGTNALSNLATLCHAHHKQAHATTSQAPSVPGHFHSPRPTQ
jgi:5-methylcytosine-specific restriction endonuclease McrA